MSDLAKAVAELEKEAEDVRELRQIVERLDTEIYARMEEIEAIGTEVLDLHGDLDNQIAEYDYMAVEQSVASLGGLVDLESVLPAIDTVLLLTALRDAEPVPDLTLPLSSFETQDSWGHPRLSQKDLDRAFETTLARADQRWEEIWGDHRWEDANERDSKRAEDRADTEREAINERAGRAGAHIMELIDYIGDTLWPDLVEAVEAGLPRARGPGAGSRVRCRTGSRACLQAVRGQPVTPVRVVADVPRCHGRVPVRRRGMVDVAEG